MKDLHRGLKNTGGWAAMLSTSTHQKQLVWCQSQLGLWQKATSVTQRDENNDQNFWGDIIIQVLNTLWGIVTVQFISKSEETEVI